MPQVSHRPEFFLGPTFITAQVLFITAKINFISVSRTVCLNEDFRHHPRQKPPYRSFICGATSVPMFHVVFYCGGTQYS